MKIIIVVLLLLFSNYLVGQNLINGKYLDYFGNEIILNDDLTFKYKWHFGSAGGWTNGTWELRKNTIYFTPVLVYDTLSIQSGDTLVLSGDEKSERVNIIEWAEYALSSWGQNRRHPPKKLFYKKKRLFHISENGTLEKKKVKNMLGQKCNTWYNKKE